MEFLGYASAIIMGMTLGTLGAGGSILTVPILVYMMKVDASLATAYSLCVVGSVSIFGALKYYRQGLVDVKTGIIFAIPALISVYATRSWLLPSLPDIILSFGDVVLKKDPFILLVFALVMMVAAFSMIRGRKQTQPSLEKKMSWKKYLAVVAQGVGVGFVAGFVGAGGGFLIIPALVMLLGLEMKKAVGTSLMIISIHSLMGFLGDLQHSANQMDWMLLLGFAFLALVGMIIGTQFSKKISSEKLKPVFGYFVLIMGTMILIKELLFTLN